MDKQSQVVKHLEMIQGVINRLAHDSFLIKGWSVTILSAAIIFIARSGVQDAWLMLAFLVPVFGFWLLDGYFLSRERIFRGIYDDVRKQDTTDFSMNIHAQTEKPSVGWLSAASSSTLRLFYLMEVIFVLVAFTALQKA